MLEIRFVIKQAFGIVGRVDEVGEKCGFGGGEDGADVDYGGCVGPGSGGGEVVEGGDCWSCEGDWGGGGV